MQLATVLDRAKSHTGSDSATGRVIGATPQEMNDYRHGRKNVPKPRRRALCEAAHLTEAETMAYFAHEAGYEKKTTSAGFAAVFVGSLVIGCAGSVVPGGTPSISAPMYKLTAHSRRFVNWLRSFDRRLTLREYRV